MTRSSHGDTPPTNGHDENIEAAWAAEIERRARRVLAGQGEFEDWEKVREQLRPRTRIE